LAAATKPWTIHRDVVDLVTKEFFAQGDRERTELKKEPNVKILKIILILNVL
jgi:dual 3',5'-cyclic-AMP and -GMP phosphodiesterase 11